MAGPWSAVCVMACVGALLSAACSGGSDHSEARHGQPPAMGRTGGVASDRVDLRSPDVDGRMDAVSRGTVFVCPRARRLEVVFDPRGTMTFMAGGRPPPPWATGAPVVDRGFP